MRALVYRGPMSMQVEEVPEPVLRPDDVLLAVEAVGICGSDVHGYAGETGRRRPGMVMGHEAAGRILELGSTVTDPELTTGQLVTFNPVLSCGGCSYCSSGATELCADREIIGVTSTYRGAYAERLVVPARNVVPVRCSPVAAALVEPFAVGLHAVRRAGVGSRDQVAVLGAGMIGLACAVCATNDGAAAVYIGDIDPAKVQLASKLGATGLVLEGQRLPAALRDLGVAEVDRAIDAIGLPQTLTDALEVVRRDGVVCLVGMASPEAGFPTYSLVTEERTLLGTFCYSAAHFQESARLLESGTVDVDMFVDAQITLEEAPEAFRALATRERSSVKTIIRP